MTVYIRTFAGHTWQLPALAGHVEGKKDYNRSLHQTRGSGRAFLSGSGRPKAQTMDVEIPCSVPIPGNQVTWDDGTNSRDMIIARRAFWEEMLANTERWYLDSRFRIVLGLMLIDNSTFSVVRAQLGLRDPGWYLTMDDTQPVNVPGILIPADTPSGGVVVGSPDTPAGTPPALPSLLPKVYPASEAGAAYNFLADLGRKATSGSVSNLGDTEITITLQDGAVTTAAVHVPTQTSFDLTMPATGLTVAPAVPGDPLRYQVVVQ